jgi:hypothetical protein
MAEAQGTVHTCGREGATLKMMEASGSEVSSWANGSTSTGNYRYHLILQQQEQQQQQQQQQQ